MLRLSDKDRIVMPSEATEMLIKIDFFLPKLSIISESKKCPIKNPMSKIVIEISI